METYFKESGQGKPIVYLHGWGADGGIFTPITCFLPEYRNIMLDFAGFGQSDLPHKCGYTVFDYASQLTDFLAELNLTNVTVVAHSFGCRVAMVVAANNPNLINRMILFAPAGLRRFSLKRWCKVRLYKIRKLFGKADAENSGSDDYKNCSAELKNTFIKVVNQDLSSFAKRVKCKTLVIAAESDTAVPAKDAKRVHKLIAKSEYCAVTGDHFALFYSPAAFAKIIKLFAEE